MSHSFLCVLCSLRLCVKQKWVGLFLFGVMLYSCSNKAKKEQEKEKILREFDSLNKSLNKPLPYDSNDGLGALKRALAPLERTEDIVDKNNAILYDSLEKKLAEAGGFGKIRQMRYVVQDCYGYLTDLERQFSLACGDTAGKEIPTGKEGDLSIANEFFFGKGPGSNMEVVFKKTRDALLANTKDSSIIAEINKLGRVRESLAAKHKDFMHAYFYNVPPVAVITILNKFELDIRLIEQRILQEYLK